MTARLTNTTRLASNCYESGNDCLNVMINSLSKGMHSAWKSIYYMPAGAAVPDGKVTFAIAHAVNPMDSLDSKYVLSVPAQQRLNTLI